MNLPMMLLLMFVAAAQGRHTPTAETEGLSVDAPDSFVVANQGATGALNLIEMVRPPETLETWSQMISVATLSNASQSTTVKQFYPIWRQGYRETCPGPRETVVNGTVDGKPALKATFYCPRDAKTDAPESLTILFVQGEVNFLTVQLSFRRAMTSADKALVQRVTKSLKVCDSRERASCSARRPTGFLPQG